MSEIKVITLLNSNGVELKISNLGATIIAINVPDKNGKQLNVVVGLEAEDYNKDFYIENGLYLGASVGRYAGRISKGGFSVKGKFYPIYNEEGVHLHGGRVGLDKKIWKIESLTESVDSSVVLSCESPHLEEGYPGNLKVEVTYKLTKNNEVKIHYSAISDADTIINLTNHAYFNLSGGGSILNHNLQLKSSNYIEVNDQLIPSGNILNSENTRFDFKEKSIIGRTDFIGFDDTFVLDNDKEQVVLESPASGICMKVSTNQPASVIYTPIQLPELPYKNGVEYTKFSAICFETQNFPDAPNNKNFPSSLLKPGEVYKNESVFEFSLI